MAHSTLLPIRDFLVDLSTPPKVEQIADKTSWAFITSHNVQQTRCCHLSMLAALVKNGTRLCHTVLLFFILGMMPVYAKIV